MALTYDANVHGTLHWWDEHPEADPAAEPVYAAVLHGHVAQFA